MEQKRFPIEFRRRMAKRSAVRAFNPLCLIGLVVCDRCAKMSPISLFFFASERKQHMGCGIKAFNFLFFMKKTHISFYLDMDCGVWWDLFGAVLLKSDKCKISVAVSTDGLRLATIPASVSVFSSDFVVCMKLNANDTDFGNRYRIGALHHPIALVPFVLIFNCIEQLVAYRVHGVDAVIDMHSEEIFAPWLFRDACFFAVSPIAEIAFALQHKRTLVPTRRMTASKTSKTSKNSGGDAHFVCAKSNSIIEIVERITKKVRTMFWYSLILVRPNERRHEWEAREAPKSDIHNADSLLRSHHCDAHFCVP